MEKFLVNDEIEVSEVRLISYDGIQLGIMSIEDARKKADEAGLDLMLIEQHSKPAVCKLIDYSKFKFEMSKKDKMNKKNSKSLDTKEIRLTGRIDKHDLDTKINQARNFIQKGHKVNLTLNLRGRELAHPQIAEDVLNVFYNRCSDIAVIEKKNIINNYMSGIVLKPKS